jgi:CRP-like cAMP-binding protein
MLRRDAHSRVDHAWRIVSRKAIVNRRGDFFAAEYSFLTVSGKFLVTEIGVELPPGSPIGELGFLTPNNRRTATVECTEAAQVLTITYERLLELYFQNPQFGYYFLVVTSQRLLQNVARMEGIIEQNKTIIVRLEGTIEQNKIMQQAESAGTAGSALVRADDVFKELRSKVRDGAKRVDS